MCTTVPVSTSLWLATDVSRQRGAVRIRPPHTAAAARLLLTAAGVTKSNDPPPLIFDGVRRSNGTDRQTDRRKTVS